VLEKRIQALLEALGAGEILKDVGAQEAATMRALIRAMYLNDAKLLFEETRTRKWDHPEPEILESVGEIARTMHAQTVARLIVPACEGLAERLSSAGAALLDVGVGVARSAIALAQMWPELRVAIFSRTARRHQGRSRCSSTASVSSAHAASVTSGSPGHYGAPCNSTRSALSR